ncbi:MAG TPA: hypothetical protein PLP88_05940 [Bacteroidales bacterium]|nr:hypothetical protein [Bacteroidales bacterium]
MALIGFKTSKPRQFNYKPLFYNKQQEEFEQKLKKVREQDSNKSEPDMRQQMNELWARRRNTTTRTNRNMRNLLFAIALVALLLYLIFFL